MRELEKQFHIDCKNGDVGKYVILPGDPGRCEQIAQYFDNSWFQHSNREFNIWNGSLDGELVTVCSTGIGAPSASIAMEELAAIGAKVFIRCGTCGGINLKVAPGDLVIPNGSVRYEHTSTEYAPIEYPAVPDFELTSLVQKASNNLNYNSHVGVIQCKDAFYGQHSPEKMPVSYELLDKWEAWKRLGVLASEMESSALFVISNALNVKCATVLHTVWNTEREKQGIVDDMDTTTDKAAQVAVEALRLAVQNDLAGNE